METEANNPHNGYDDFAIIVDFRFSERYYSVACSRCLFTS